ncbi:MAG: TerC family protein [Chloroflexi bacterium]|nr:TerC family protein [Chloroflexota bacterium]
MEELLTPQAAIGFLTLLLMEIVLGIDNIVFISILTGKLPKKQQPRARQLGLGLALGFRIALLLAVSWIIGLTEPLFTIFEQGISVRDLILIGGGLFLLAKATSEIHDRLEGETGHASKGVPPSFGAVILQILLLDAVFSIDSILTAVGMVREVEIMILAVIGAIVVMLLASGRISDFVNNHPTVKMLALSFLLLIGVMLIVEGLHQHIPRGYIYFAMGFSLFVEMLNLRSRAHRQPVELHQPYAPEGQEVH